MIYIAFLRGINVGGKRQVKMEDLKKDFESLGFTGVQTLLNSGNVIFSSTETNSTVLTQKIEEKLAKTFGWEIGVILRTSDQIQDLINSDPFKDISITPETRLYVTFLSEKPRSNLKIPHDPPDKSFRIIHLTDSEVCSVVLLSTDKNTTDLMKFLEKEFGKKVTTRNWNTIIKIAEVLV